MKTIPSRRVVNVATVSLSKNSTSIGFNKSAILLLALKQNDRIGFDWDGRKLYLIIPDPDGFVVRQYSKTFSISGSALKAKIEKLIGKSNPRFEIEEFKEGRWPLKLI